MDEDTQANMKPIITGYNPASQPGSEPILPSHPPQSSAAAKPAPMKINVLDGPAPVLPGLAPRPVPTAVNQPAPTPAPTPPPPIPAPNPTLVPTPPQPFKSPMPGAPPIQTFRPNGQTAEQLMQLKTKTDSHPLFATDPSTNAQSANSGQSVKHRSPATRILIWTLIILVILAPAAFVAYHFGLISR